MKIILFKGKYADLGVPGRVHIPACDGGHLIIKPHRHVVDSSQLPFNEAQELPLLEKYAKCLLEVAFGPKFFNTQENGNWSAKKPVEQQHAIRHVYGRKEDAMTQPYGEALVFPSSNDLQGFGYDYSEADMEALRGAVQVVVQEPWVPQDYRALNTSGMVQLPQQPKPKLKM